MSEAKRKLGALIEENARLSTALGSVAAHLARKENKQAYEICVTAMNGGGETAPDRSEALPTYRFLDSFMRLAIASQMRAAVVMLTPTRDGHLTLQLGGFLPIQRMLEKLFKSNEKWIGTAVVDEMKKGGQ